MFGVNDRPYRPAKESLDEMMKEAIATRSASGDRPPPPVVDFSFGVKDLYDTPVNTLPTFDFLFNTPGSSPATNKTSFGTPANTSAPINNLFGTSSTSAPTNNLFSTPTSSTPTNNLFSASTQPNTHTNRVNEDMEMFEGSINTAEKPGHISGMSSTPYFKSNTVSRKRRLSEESTITRSRKRRSSEDDIATDRDNTFPKSSLEQSPSSKTRTRVRVFGFNRDNVRDFISLFTGLGVVTETDMSHGNWITFNYATPEAALRALSFNGISIDNEHLIGVTWDETTSEVEFLQTSIGTEDSSKKNKSESTTQTMKQSEVRFYMYNNTLNTATVIRTGGYWAVVDWFQFTRLYLRLWDIAIYGNLDSYKIISRNTCLSVVSRTGRTRSRSEESFILKDERYTNELYIEIGNPKFKNQPIQKLVQNSVPFEYNLEEVECMLPKPVSLDYTRFVEFFCDSVNIPTWKKENSSLFDAICQARVSKHSANDLRRLLKLNKEKFLNLLDDEPKNTAHRANLNNNTAYINGESANVSKDFVTKALFISDQLNVNENVAATLLMCGIIESSRVDSNPIDTAVHLYLDERGYLLECFSVILRSAKDPSISEEIRTVCYQFTSELLNESIPSSGNQTTTLVGKLLKTFEDLSQTINSLIMTGSATNQLPTAGSGKLGEDISNLRIDMLSDQRVLAVQILYHIVSLFNVNTDEKLKILELLEEGELTDNATSYMIISMISALSNDNQPEEEQPSESTLDFIDRFHNRIMTHGARVPAIKAIIVLQWISYLSDPCRVNFAIDDTKPGRSESDIQQLMEHSLSADVFGFMNEYLLYFQQPNALIKTDRSSIKQEVKSRNDFAKEIDMSDYHNCNADIYSEFQPFVVYELEKLGLSLISVQFDTLKQLKYKEENTNAPLQTPLSTGNAVRSEANNNDQCHDLQYFLTFLASVFRNRVNRGTVFWDQEQRRLRHFIRWLLGVYLTETVIAVFDFFGSISTGDSSAEKMFHFMKRDMKADLASSPMLSWGKPFAALQSYASQLNSLNGEPRVVISETEEQLLLKFLVILRQCIQYSREARHFFWTDPVISTPNVLISLLNCETSTALRAAIFDVFSAFCSPWGGGVDGLGRHISCSVWKIFEDSDVFIPRRTVCESGVLYQPPGLLQAFENEKSSQVYNETLSIIRVIGSAIHTQSKLEYLKSGFQIAPSSIPHDLGKSSKYPGAIPYITLVVDRIFTSIASQKYKFAEARWELTEACLVVMENSLFSFDVRIFENENTRTQLDRGLKALSSSPDIESALLAYLIHPGFQVIIRILQMGRVVDELFSVIENCAVKDIKKAENMPYRQKCLVRSLRILRRVLELQHTVCTLLIPYITGFSRKKSFFQFQLTEYTFESFPPITPLGKLILIHGKILKEIALLMNYIDQEEVCFLSTKILDILSADPKKGDGNNENVLSRAVALASFKSLGPSIAELLRASSVSTTIIFGVSQTLSIDLPEVITGDDYEYDINNIPFWLAEETLNNKYNYPLDSKLRIGSSVRLAILDLLINNVIEKSKHTLTDFLLGYDVKDNSLLKQIGDTDNNRPSLVLFHAILNLLQQGLDKSSSTDFLIDTHPILAEKCYHLIYKLCSNKSLSLSTLRYLRNHEDFFYKQLDSLPGRIEQDIETNAISFGGRMVLPDGSQYQTDFFKLRSRLHQRAWLLRSIALELRTTVNTRQKNETKRLLKLLYGRANVFSDDNMEVDNAQKPTVFNKTSIYQQSLAKMLELFSSLEFSWTDYLTDSTMTSLNYFKSVDADKFMFVNERGCELFDIREIYKALKAVQSTMSEEEIAASNPEVQSILSCLIAKNHIREINFGKIQCLEAWKEVVRVTFVECSDSIDQEFRESVACELLDTVVPKTTDAKDYKGDVFEGMSEIVQVLLDQLRSEEPDRTAKPGLFSF